MPLYPFCTAFSIPKSPNIYSNTLFAKILKDGINPYDNIQISTDDTKYLLTDLYFLLDLIEFNFSFNFLPYRYPTFFIRPISHPTLLS